MKKFLVVFLVFLLFFGCQFVDKTGRFKKQGQKFTDVFSVDKNNLLPTGKNPYFILQPGYTLKFEGKEDGKSSSNVIEVTNQTKVIDGVETRVVKDTHRTEGKVDEITLDYFAIDKVTNSVFYFGEDVDNIENGKVINHEGTWHSGEKGAKFGLIMPGINLIGARYMQEIAPDIALDRAETVSLDESVSTTAGNFKNCLKTKESSPLEPGITEYKVYAPGVGFVQEIAKNTDLRLVEKGFE